MRRTLLAVSMALLVSCAPTVTAARAAAPARWGGYSFEVVDEGGQVLPTYAHRGRTYILGTVGQRYLVRVRNETPRRVEVVISVDGRDVIDGGPAAWGKRGYLVEPYATATIDGYRLSQDAIAAFRFSSVPRSYAALQGDARDVGILGVAVFRERDLYVPRAENERRPAPEVAPHRGDAAGAERSAAPSAAPPPGASDRMAKAQRQGLGTEFGEEHASHVRLVPFERAGATPDVVLTARYDDREGLAAAGVLLDRGPDEVELRSTAEPFRRDAGYARPPPGWRPGA